MTGLRKPGNPILGSDIAGTVVAVGQNHTEFNVGEAVFGELPGYRWLCRIYLHGW
ncbi:MAG: alcohol dehydrogenase catalytic domain-containing protein [Caldilineaceae bacterium]